MIIETALYGGYIHALFVSKALTRSRVLRSFGFSHSQTTRAYKPARRTFYDVDCIHDMCFRGHLLVEPWGFVLRTYRAGNYLGQQDEFISSSKRTINWVDTQVLKANLGAILVEFLSIFSPNFNLQEVFWLSRNRCIIILQISATCMN